MGQPILRGGRNKRKNPDLLWSWLPGSKLRETKVCAERDNFNDWIQKCPVPSRYSEWGLWSCNSRCFNPRRRGGTYQTRTRRCIDDTPNKHKTQNCLTMHSLEEKVTPCLSDP